MISQEAHKAHRPGLRAAYMLGTFPSLTETFVRREIAAVQQRGIDVVICAIRRPRADTTSAGPEINAHCVYARPDSILRHIVANLGYFLRRPPRYFRSLLTFLRAAAVLPARDALQLLYHFVAGIGFARDLKRMGVGHLHCHFASATNMALAAHMVTDMPFSFTVHASDDLFMRPVLMGEKVEGARFVVGVCEYSREFLDSITGFRFSKKLHRVYNGVSQAEAQRKSMTDEGAVGNSNLSGKGRIVSVGSLLPLKGHPTLIRACARLLGRGLELHCRIIGEGPERPVLERLILEHDLGNSVELAGALSLDEVYAELDRADVFVLLAQIGPCGYRDGFPTVILEAMAAGLPVVASSLSGIPEMVEDGVTGTLVRERDVEGASRALESLLRSAELRQAMGRAGQERVQKLFNVDRSADQLVALLTQNFERASA